MNTPNPNVTFHEVDTKPSKDGEAIRTNLSINWEGMAPEDIRALAAAHLIVKAQVKFRNDGIPSGDHTVNAVDYKVGVRAPRQAPDVFKLVPNLSDEQRAALLAQLQAMQSKR